MPSIPSPDEAARKEAIAKLLTDGEEVDPHVFERAAEQTATFDAVIDDLNNFLDDEDED
ncbi:hypothetical protein [Gryllotalpicola sp.]|uniref:hypothetical protein n=1 Tax=Gryllotalpicola sp. TaxID=1932787 RepID=UPI0026128884|nr:hypothetical protein [Gryllotalpicola sp.]